MQHCGTKQPEYLIWALVTDGFGMMLFTSRVIWYHLPFVLETATRGQCDLSFDHHLPVRYNDDESRFIRIVFTDADSLFLSSWF